MSTDVQPAPLVTIVGQSNMSDRQGTITVQAATQELVLSPEGRTAALQHAVAQGLSRPGISSHGGAYPIDAEGRHDEDVMMGRRPTVGYRCDYRVTAGL